MTIFKYKVEWYIVRAKKVDKKWGIPCILPELWSLNCPKKLTFCNFVLTSARNLSLLKHFTYMHLKALIPLFQKTISLIGVWATVHEILAINVSKKMLSQQQFKKNTLVSNPNISKTVRQSMINNTIFWKFVTKPFWWMYVNCFNRLRFLVEVSIKMKNWTFLDNLRTITQEGDMETRQMTPFSHLLFSL